MQIWTDQTDYHFHHQPLQTIFTEEVLFFDIETTGFSPAKSSLYLIGCARRKQNKLIIDQYFAEQPAEEKLLLLHFLKLLEDYNTIITFHGTSFDIPYLTEKCRHYQLPEPFHTKHAIDLFKTASSLKFLLKLPNYKQKTLEAFFNIQRKDTFHGGELIRVYQHYLRQPSEALLLCLKQHNYEDVSGMTELLGLLSYHRFFQGEYTISSIEGNCYNDYFGTEQKELLFSLQTAFPLPKRVSCRYDAFYLTADGFDAKLSVLLCEAELKFFFPNYKDYYYLPAEDCAIHKDAAAYIEKDCRKKATAATCYVKKTSIFLPQYQLITEPAFRKNYKDKLSYFELTDCFIANEQLIYQYVQHILALMASQKS